MWLYLCMLFCDEVLWLENGDAIRCVAYERRLSVVLVRAGREIYSLPADKVDWEKTRRQKKTQENPPPVPEPAPEVAREAALPTFEIAKLDVKDAAIKDLLRFLTDMADLNLVIDGSVEDSRATYFLQNIPWNVAFDIVLRNAGLDYAWMYGAVRIGRLLP